MGKWVCADCAEAGGLGAEDVYDVCIDKGATDSLFESYTADMWERGSAMVHEVHRVLRPGGLFVVISNAGVGGRVFDAVFPTVESESIEGYSCDLYYKVLCVILC